MIISARLARAVPTTRDNIVYACHACNEFKGDYWGELEADRLPHPVHDEQAWEFDQELDGTIRARSGIGERLIERLYLNRPQLRTRRRDQSALQLVIERQQLELRLQQEILRQLTEIRTMIGLL